MLGYLIFVCYISKLNVVRSGKLEKRYWNFKDEDIFREKVKSYLNIYKMN